MKSNELNWRFQGRHAGPPYRIRAEQRARVCVYYTEMCVAAVSLYDQMTINSCMRAFDIHVCVHVNLCVRVCIAGCMVH